MKNILLAEWNLKWFRKEIGFKMVDVLSQIKVDEKVLKRHHRLKWRINIKDFSEPAIPWQGTRKYHGYTCFSVNEITD